MFYEFRTELDNRAAWLGVPLDGKQDMLENSTNRLQVLDVLGIFFGASLLFP